MTSLIDDILMISRLESKDAEVTLSKVNLKKRDGRRSGIPDTTGGIL